LLWHCTGPEGVPQVLGLPPRAWWGGLLTWADASRGGVLSYPISWVARTLMAKLGRAVFIAFIDANVQGDGRPWDVPERMKQRLRVRTGPVAQKGRRARRHTRRAVRRMVANAS